jgi:hypothetical protein
LLGVTSIKQEWLEMTLIRTNAERNGQITFRAFRGKDEDNIIQLIRPCWKHFNSDRARDFWAWEYTNSPLGRALIVLAEHNGKLVGHYAMLRVQMSWGRSTIPTGKTEGAFVHPLYRGNIAPTLRLEQRELRIFQSLTEKLFAAAQEERIDIVWGLPIYPALKAHVRLGHHYIRIPQRISIFPIDQRKAFEALLSRRIANKLFLKVLAGVAAIYYELVIGLLGTRKTKAPDLDARTLRRLSRFDDNTDRFWERFLVQNTCITIKRDQAYLNWRFVENPVIPHQVFACERGAEITSYVVTCITRERYAVGNIVDILCLEGHDDDLAVLLDHVVSFLRNERVVCISAWFAKNKQSERYLRILKEKRFLVLRLGKVNLRLQVLNPDLDTQFAYDPDNWYITPVFREGIRGIFGEFNMPKEETPKSSRT